MENRKAPLGRLAADKIEAVCWVDADELIKGKLVSIGGGDYTAKHWKQAMRAVFSLPDMEGMQEDIQLRAGLLILAAGPKRAGYAINRMRQMMDKLKEELKVSDEAIDAAGQKLTTQAFAQDETIGSLTNRKWSKKEWMIPLQRFNKKDQVNVTYEGYIVWPPKVVELPSLVASDNEKQAVRVILPDSTLLTHHGEAIVTKATKLEPSRILQVLKDCLEER